MSQNGKIRVDAKFDENKSFKTVLRRYLIKISLVIGIIALLISKLSGYYILNNNIGGEKSILIVTMIDIIFISLSIGAIVFLTNKYVSATTRLLNGLRVHIAYLASGVYHYKIKEKYFAREDEVGHICVALNDLQNSIKKMIEDMKAPTNAMADQAINLNEISNDLSNTTGMVSNEINTIVTGILGEASDIEGVNNKISDLNKLINKAIDSINNLSCLAANVNNNAEKSHSDLKIITDSLDGFNKIFNDFLKTLEDMNGSIKKVSEITDLINNVAEQTNLLALNAAIEAARAGDAGRGFTVVAEEIRKLSDKTKESSVSINYLINNILTSSDDLVSKTSKMTDELDNQHVGMNNSIMSFNIISDSVTEMDGMIEEILRDSRVISESQSEIIEKVTFVTSVNQKILSSVQEIAASSEETNSTSSRLLDYAEELKKNAEISSNYINKFILDGLEEEE